jgi:hypothetical protein
MTSLYAQNSTSADQMDSLKSFALETSIDRHNQTLLRLITGARSGNDARTNERQSMKTTTLNKLIENSNIPKSLIRAVVRQMGGWESFTESAPNICRHGIDGGFEGFIYNSETEAFARRNRAAIAEMASEQAKDFGTGIMEMIRGFGCFRNGTPPTDEAIGSALYAGKDLKDGEPVLNALAWYAGEEVSREYCRMTEQD